jgi:site-specific recombinase XerD
MITKKSTLLEFYRLVYQPAKHPGDRQRTTIESFESAIGVLDRFARDRQAVPGLYGVQGVRLENLSDELVVGCMNWLVDQGRSRATANKLRRHINALWRLAQRRSIVKTGPINERYRENLADPIAFLPEEFAKLLATAKRTRGWIGQAPASDWWTFFLLLAYNVGGRIQALRLIETKSLDLTRGEVLLAAHTQKQRKDQRIKLFPSTLAACTKLKIVERRLPTLLGDCLFGSPWLRRKFSDLLVEAGLFTSRADIPRTLKFHALRKTLASKLAAEHGEHVACSILGHSQVTVTRRYIDPRYIATPSVPELIADPAG